MTASNAQRSLPSRRACVSRNGRYPRRNKLQRRLSLEPLEPRLAFSLGLGTDTPALSPPTNSTIGLSDDLPVLQIDGRWADHVHVIDANNLQEARTWQGYSYIAVQPNESGSDGSQDWNQVSAEHYAVLPHEFSIGNSLLVVAISDRVFDEWLATSAPNTSNAPESWVIDVSPLEPFMPPSGDPDEVPGGQTGGNAILIRPIWNDSQSTPSLDPDGSLFLGRLENLLSPSTEPAVPEPDQKSNGAGSPGTSGGSGFGAAELEQLVPDATPLRVRGMTVAHDWHVPSAEHEESEDPDGAVSSASLRASTTGSRKTDAKRAKPNANLTYFGDETGEAADLAWQPRSDTLDLLPRRMKLADGEQEAEAAAHPDQRVAAKRVAPPQTLVDGSDLIDRQLLANLATLPTSGTNRELQVVREAKWWDKIDELFATLADFTPSLSSPVSQLASIATVHPCQAAGNARVSANETDATRKPNADQEVPRPCRAVPLGLITVTVGLLTLSGLGGEPLLRRRTLRRWWLRSS